MEYIFIRSREHLKRVMRKYEKPKRMLTYDTLRMKNCYVPSEDIFLFEGTVKRLGYTEIDKNSEQGTPLANSQTCVPAGRSLQDPKQYKKL